MTTDNLTPTSDGRVVVVYTKPTGCQQCVMTKRWLTEREIPFTEVDLTQDEAAIEKAKRHQIMAAPMVSVRPEGTPEGDAEIIFSGFRADVLGTLFPAADFPRAASGQKAA